MGHLGLRGPSAAEERAEQSIGPTLAYWLQSCSFDG